MAANDTWSVEGLEPGLRETAREAARQQGLTVHEWLQSVIAASAANSAVTAPRREARAAAPVARETEQPAPSPAANPPSARAQSITTRLGNLSQQLERLSRVTDEPVVPPAFSVRQTARPAAPEGPLVTPAPPSQPPVAASAAVSSQLAETLQELNRRLDRLERRPAAEPAPPAPAQAPTASAPPTAQAATEADWTLAVDSALAEIAERQRVLDDEAQPAAPQEEPMQRPVAASPSASSSPAHPAGLVDEELSEDLRALTDELRVLRGAGGVHGAIHALREELADIGQRLMDAVPRRALQALEDEVRALSARVDSSRHGVDRQTFVSIEGALLEIRSALKNFAPAESLTAVRMQVAALESRIDAVASTAGEAVVSVEALRHIEQAIAELRKVAAHAASGDALIALAEEVQTIGDRVERIVSSNAAASSNMSNLLEQRFHELAAHLDSRANALASAPDELTRMVEQMAVKLDRADIGRSNAPLLDTIAQQIGRLTDHVEAADTRFQSLDQFDHSMRDLYRSMEDLRASTITTAERAARDAAAQIAAQTTPPELLSLREDVHNLRQSDQRTHDTLEAVHDTLERLVDRLALIETNIRQDRAQPRMESAAAPAPLTVAVRPASSAVAMEVPRAEPPQLDASVAPVASLERRPIDPTLPADHPLEPGTGSRGRPATPAERIAASEAALEGIRPASEGDAKSNFIAAARRAAQAAASMSSQSDAEAGSDKSGSAIAAFAKKITGRRALLLALILVASAGALHVALNGVELPRFASFSNKQPAVASTTAAPETTGSVPAKSVPTVAVPAPATPVPAPQSADTPASPPPAAATNPDGRTVSTVSPLTIAGIQIPAGATGQAARATGLTPGASAPPAPARPIAGDIPATFSKTLRTAALAGDAGAEYEVGLRYAEGRGVPVNFENAAHWFERASNRGLALAQYRLGSLYEKGQGVRKDVDQARRLYRAAADQGNAKAMHNLAVLYAEGMDGKPDFKLAADWFRKAAAYGVSDSQYNLGILYARGMGVEQNLPESYKWFALAAQQGDPDAGKKRDEVAARLDQQALVAARLAVQTFTIDTQPHGATTTRAPAGGWDAAGPAKPPAKPATTSRRQTAS